MFKLESYIAPLLMGYIDKYVKLKKEDFQLSLWGGDAVLNKLDLRLDAIEHALKLPITFKSGHIHELQIHVPWTRLGSEPVVITINTIECILKLRDSAHQDDSSSTSSAVSPKPPTPNPKVRPVRPKEGEDLPPGYLASLMNRVMHNVNLVINNLILKFVEDDIVLSVNVKSMECYSVNQDWTRAFVELSLPDLALRKVVDVSDLTICLDKRNASGKIETYQDPLLYRCSLTCRLLMFHDSLHAKLPTITKFNVFCDKLDLSLTDTQLPMFFRLVELCIAIYYGTLELGGQDTSAIEEPAATAKDIRDHIPVEIPGSPPVPDGEGDGWASWAWSYVPQILPPGEEEEEEEEGGGARPKQEPPVLALSFYVHHCTVNFKLTEVVKEGVFYGSQKVSFKPFLVWEAEGINTEVIMRGLVFFNVQFGVSYTRVLGLGASLCGTQDLNNTGRSPCFLESGTKTTVTRQTDYLTNSLFDPGGFENQGMKPEFIFVAEVHMEYYTETYGRHRFGAMWMDYLYTMEETEDRPGGSKSSSSISPEDHHTKENSTIRILLGPGELTVNSSMVQRCHKLYHCITDHDYEPYSKPKKEVVDESRLPPTEQEVQRLEEFVPIRTYLFTLLQMKVVIMAADLGKYDVKHNRTVSQRKSSKGQKKSGEGENVTQKHLRLPVIVLQADRFDYQMTTAMYPRQLVQKVSVMPTPSASLLHQCHIHTYYKMFGVQMGVSTKEPGQNLSPIHNIVQPSSGVYYLKKLLFSMYWKNPLQPRVEMMFELPQLTVNLTKAQGMLLAHTALTWTEPTPNPQAILRLSLLNDIFKHTGRGASVHPVLEMTLGGLEVRQCRTDAAQAWTGSLTAVQAILLHHDSGGDSITPLLYGPLDTSSVYQKEGLETQTPTETPTNTDLVTFTVQIPSKPNMPQAPGAIFVDIQGVVGSLDPKLSTWLEYCPRTQPSGGLGADSGRPGSQGLVVDVGLVEATSPLKQHTSQASAESQAADSRSLTASRTQTQTQGRDDPPEGEEVANTRPGWGDRLAALFPLVKIVEIQVNIKPWCAFFPSKHVSLPDPSMNIPANMAALRCQGRLPDTIAVCCPSIHVSSSGHKPLAPSQEIPIKSLEQSVAGEKLPWSIALSQGSLYTVQVSTKPHYVLHPSSVSATVAVTTKYHPPTSDNITSLGLCLHTDMDNIVVGCSTPQVKLAHTILMSHIRSVTRAWESVQLLQQLHTPHTLRGADTDPQGGASPLPPSSTPHVLGAGTATAHTAKVTTSSSPADPPDYGVATITETSETASRDMSPTAELDEKADVKLSLWLQWTLLKFEAKLYSADSQGNALCLVTEAEDLTTAIDIQGVYAKVKCKVGALNISHHVKSGSTWCLGSHKGVVLSCSDQLAQNLQVATNKLWTAGQSMPCSYTSEDLKPLDSSRGFLLFTFTRALRKSVKKKLIKAGVTEIDCDNSEDEKTDRGLVYLNEVCLNIQPCDVVLNCPAMAPLLHMVTTFSSATGSSQLSGSGHVRPGLTPKVTRSTEVKPSLPWFTADVLPLIYINATKFRMFIPKFGSEPDIGPESPLRGPESKPLREDDLCVIQIGSLSLVPAADNPLPRVVVEKDIYRRAVQSGLTGQPGAEVEDRQYQLDITGLGLSTGRWRDISDGSLRTQSHSVDVSAQNPALEWNTLPQTQSESDEVKLIPIAASFDLKIVGAPAVVYNHTDLLGPKQLLVCGYSLEVNATSDMDFYLSTSQATLLSDVITTNFMTLLTPSPTERGPVPRERHHQPDHDEQSANDSGVESEASTLNTVTSRPVVAVTLQPKEAEVVGKSADSNAIKQWLGHTPFEVLLTAGKITLTLYSHKEIVQQPGKPDTGQNSPQEKGPSPGDSRVLWPFLYAYFSQPYTLVSCHHNTQKSELSCYDLVLKGSKPGHCITEEQKLLPDLGDFTVHWVETRAGRLDNKTGVPPSLYTLSATDFLSQSAEIKIDLERPLKVNLSLTKIQQVMGFVEILTKDLLSLKSTSSPAKREKKATLAASDSKLPHWVEPLFALQAFKVHTVQVVLDLETVPGKSQSGMTLMIADFNCDVMLQKDSVVHEHEVSIDLLAQDIMCRTRCQGHSQTLIGPFPFHTDLSLLWAEFVPLESYPRILCFIDLGMVPAYIGQEHILCAEVISNHLTEFVKQLPAGPSTKTTPISQTTSAKSSANQSTNDVRLRESTDDLRTGDFSYITDESFDMAIQPNRGEIVFASDNSAGQAAMTWCYPEPRVVTRLTANPVPFSLPREVDVRFINEGLKVPCVLQYWSSIGRSYEDHAQFSLSENDGCHVELPSLSLDDVSDGKECTTATTAQPMAAEIWRVLILRPEEMEKSVTENTEDQDGDTVPVISPMSLAASLSVDSCHIPSLIPLTQVSLSATRVQLHLASHLTHLGKETATKLKPFTLERSCQDMEVAMVTIEGPSAIVTHSPIIHQVAVQLKAGMSCSVVDESYLTNHTLLDMVTTEGKINYNYKAERQSVSCEFALDHVSLRLSQSLLHTLDFIYQSWCQLHCSRAPALILNYYVICNDTRNTLRYTQVGSDENLEIKSREAVPYSWRTLRGTQLLRFGVEGVERQWSDPVDVTRHGYQVCTVGGEDQQATLVVNVKSITNTLTQIVISGQILVASRLSENLDVRLLTHKPLPHDNYTMLAAGAALPSVVVEHSNVRALKVRLVGTHNSWSQEVPITGEKMKESRLVKVPSYDKCGFIHVWCHIFCQQHRIGTQNLGSPNTNMQKRVMFSPVFVVRTQMPVPLAMNIHTPRHHSVHQVELLGQGRHHQLHSMAGDMTHSVTFQISPAMKASSPPLSLSSGMIEQVERRALDSPDLMSLANDGGLDQHQDWPYNAQHSSGNGVHTKQRVAAQDVVVSQTTPSASSSGVSSTDFLQPDIDLQVNLKQLWAGFNTLLIDISPHWLAVNEAGVSLTLVEHDDKQWNIPTGQTLAPPQLKAPFQVGVIHENQLHLSSPITLSHEDNIERYLPFVEGLLYTRGSLELSVPVERDGKLTKMCYLTVHSTMKDNMRIVTIREKYHFSNWLSQDLAIQCYSVPLSPNKVNLNHAEQPSLNVSQKKQEGDNTALLFWNVLVADETDLKHDSSDFVQYICFSFVHQSEESLNNSHQSDSLSQIDGYDWSFPCRVRTTDNGCRENVSVPVCEDSQSKTRPCVMSSQSDKLVTYLIVAQETSPSIELHNNCNLVLHFGQTLLGVSSQGCTVQEEAELISQLPKIPPYGSCHYAFPSWNNQFPEIQPTPKMAKLHLAGSAIDCDESGKLSEGHLPWSQGIDLSTDNDMFVSIPEVADVKVHKESVGHTLHIYIDPISRAEVSAKEIRSRIKGKEVLKVEKHKKDHGKRRKRTESESSVVDHDVTSPSLSRRESIDAKPTFPKPKKKPAMPITVNFTCYCQKGSFVLLQESQKTQVISELCRLTVDDVCLLYSPHFSISSQTFRRSHSVQNLQMFVRDLQVDNQLCGIASYDFPVVLQRQHIIEQTASGDIGEQNHENMRKNCLIQIRLDLCYDHTEKLTSVKEVKIAFKPLSLYVEDTFIYEILKVIDGLIPVQLSCDSVQPISRKHQPPKPITANAMVLNWPIRLKRLEVSPVKMLLSVHASMKVFIASENSPLHFGKFEREEVFTSGQQLTRGLTMHYASGALFRAGLVVGSLEILGNPTGLVRNISSGVVDLFRLPYEGLTQSPGAFIGGVTSGMGSLLKHISTGTITSITNFASSVSRNMERLSLDTDHRVRLEEARRQRPAGLSEGLKNGFTEFGISLLGAVGGIAEQPLMTLTRPTDPLSPPPSSARAATTLVSAVGKGLVGAVTKPIGGAAELVSQTGMGLLQGTGLTRMPLPRERGCDVRWEELANSNLKYTQKMFSSVPHPEVLIQLSGRQERGGGPQSEACIILTPEILFVVCPEEDLQLQTDRKNKMATMIHQAFAVSNVDIRGSKSDSSLIHILLKSADEPTINWEDNLSNRDRVAEFVSGKKISKSQSDVALSELRSPSRGCYDFTVGPVERQLFLSLFSLAKNKLTGSGFAV